MAATKDWRANLTRRLGYSARPYHIANEGQRCWTVRGGRLEHNPALGISSSRSDADSDQGHSFNRVVSLSTRVCSLSDKPLWRKP